MLYKWFSFANYLIHPFVWFYLISGLLDYNTCLIKHQKNDISVREKKCIFNGSNYKENFFYYRKFRSPDKCKF